MQVMNAILISALFLNVTTVGTALAAGKSDGRIAEWQARQTVPEGSSVRLDGRRLARCRRVEGAQGRDALRPQNFARVVCRRRELRVKRSAATSVWKPRVRIVSL